MNRINYIATSRKLLFALFSVLFLICIFFIHPLKVKAEDTSQYYGIQCRRHITAELAKHSEIPGWKQIEIIDKLSDDGYFWMTTIVQKKKYLHANLDNTKALQWVPVVENRYNWHVPSSSNSIKAKDSVDAQTYYLNLANENYTTWRSIVLKIGKGYYYEGADVCKERFLRKKNWLGNDGGKDLDFFYSQWPDLKKKYSGEFTATEKARLERTWSSGKFDNIIIAARDKIPSAGSIGFTGNSPIDDILWFIPVEKVAAIAGKAALKPVTQLGSKLITGVGKKVEAYGLRKAAQKSASRVITVRVRGSIELFGEAGAKLDIDLTKMFERSSIPIAKQRSLTIQLIDTVDKLSNMPQFKKYFGGATEAAILAHTKVYSKKAFIEEYGVKAWGLCTHSRSHIVLNESGIKAGHQANIVIHESLHYASPADLSPSYKYFTTISGSRYYPLQEGITEFFADYAMRSLYNKGSYGAYEQEVRVVSAIYTNLAKRYKNKYKDAETKAFEALQECYFRGGDEHLLSIDKHFTAGFHDKLHYFMKNGRYDEAIKYVNSF